MKKIFCFTLLAAMFAACTSVDTETQKKDVQQVLTRYFTALGAQNWDAVKENTTHDMQLVEDGLIWNNDSLINNISTFWSKYDIRYDLDILQTTIHKNSAWIVYKNHGNASYRTDNIHINWIETAYLIHKNGKWKISMIHSSIDDYSDKHYENADDLDVPALSVYDKHERAINLYYKNILANIAIAREQGLSIKKHATSVGRLYESCLGDQSGFDAFVSGIVLNFETFRFRYDYPLEIIENTGDRVLLKWKNNYEGWFDDGPYLGVTYQELTQWFEIFYNTIAEINNATVTYERIEGDWILVTIEKKNSF